MSLNEMDHLDALIEEALRSEPMKPVPAGFQKRMESRLKVAALVQRERQGFHFRVFASALVFAALGLVIIGVPTIAFFQGWVVRSVPGAMGYFDYLVLFALHSWDRILLAAGIAALIVLAAIMVRLVAPALRSRAQKQH